MSETMRKNAYSRDVVLIWVAGFFYLCCSMSTAPIVAGYAESIGASGLWMGIISALITGVAVVCRPITGNLSDRTEKFRLVLAGCLMMIAASVGYVVLPYVWSVALFRCLHGVGYACCSIGMSTWLTMLLPPEKLGSGVGMYGTVNALAMAVAPVIGGFLYGSVDLRLFYPLLSVFSFLCIGMYFICRRIYERPKEAA